ncbi:MAG: thioredoxin domain-containing protein, partial [Bradymonadia bacterium]
HFEKMLYDNAQLVPVYLDMFTITQDSFYRHIVEETLEYVAREMTNAKGGFYSATDADSTVPGKDHQEEGWYFTWSLDEFRATIDSSSRQMLEAYFRVTKRGNFEGRNILHVRMLPNDFAQKHQLDVDQFFQLLGDAKSKLYKVRTKRTAPLRDEKVIASWNGLMISAFAKAGFALKNERYLTMARTAGRHLVSTLMMDDGSMHRTFMNHRARHPGVLDDYAFVTQAFLDLFEVTWDEFWLTHALKLQHHLDEHHWDAEHGGYFMTGDRQEKLLSRDKPSYDGAEPSGNAVALMNLSRLSVLTGHERYRRRAVETLEAFSGQLKQGNRGMMKMLSALESSSDDPFEIVIARTKNDTQVYQAILDVIRQTYLPNRALVVMAAKPSMIQHVPWTKGKVPLSGRTTVYVCKRGVCKRPIHEPGQLKKELENIVTLYPDRTPSPLRL